MGAAAVSDRRVQPTVSTSSPFGACDGQVRRDTAVQEAVGILMHRLDLCSEDACALLSSSARAMDLDAVQLARTIIAELESRSRLHPQSLGVETVD
jgi:hypothetical protein